MIATLITNQVMQHAKTVDQRTGQYLFNLLPYEITSFVAGRPFDPFFKDLTKDEVYQWIEDHLIFQGKEIIGVFDGDRLLWCAPSQNIRRNNGIQDVHPKALPGGSGGDHTGEHG